MFYMERFSLRAQTLTKILCLLFLFAFTITGLSAQVKLSVQGLVKKSDGTALPDGNYDLTFRFYDDETGGSALGTETVTTEINGGVYSAVLGPNGGLNSLAFNIPYYVSVAVDGGTELLPRIALSAAPYAISLQGANNKFPSIGTVKADAIDVVGAVSAASYGAVNATTVTASGQASASNMVVLGGAPGSPVAGKGYSFGAGGDADAGLFSVGDNNVALYANATKVLEATNSGVAIQGNQSVSGNANIGFTMSARDVNADFGTVKVMRAQTEQGGNLNFEGFSFVNSSNQQLLSGMSCTNDGNTVRLFTNNTEVMFADPNGFNIIPTLYLRSAPNMTDGDNLEWRSNVAGGRVGVNTSSRRYKSNIQPLVTDFSKILQVQPRIYNRKSEDPSLWEIGYIAEELDSLGLKNLVLYDQEGRPNSLIYKKFVLYTNEVVKMHHTDIEKLKAEVAALTAEKNALRTENASLRADVQHQQADFGKQLDAISRRLKSLETAASNR